MPIYVILYIICMPLVRQVGSDTRHEFSLDVFAFTLVFLIASP